MVFAAAMDCFLYNVFFLLRRWARLLRNWGNRRDVDSFPVPVWHTRTSTFPGFNNRGYYSRAYRHHNGLAGRQEKVMAVSFCSVSRCLFCPCSKSIWIVWAYSQQTQVYLGNSFLCLQFKYLRCDYIFFDYKRPERIVETNQNKTRQSPNVLSGDPHSNSNRGANFIRFWLAGNYLFWQYELNSLY